MPIHEATEADIPAILSLLHVRRQEYQHYAPTFWKIAQRAVEKQEPFIRLLVGNTNVLSIVHENDDHVDGVLIATMIEAPPVYDPGGKVCMVDDYMVERPELWKTVGDRLLEHCRQWAKTQGCVLELIVCAQKDVSKSVMLRDTGAEVASEWYVRDL